MKFKSNVELEALSNATTDTDRFIVSDSNTLKYRTGSQVLSDIGGQASLTNPVTGTGTLNFVSKFTSTGSTLGNSVIYDNGTNVGIGTTSPTSYYPGADNLVVKQASGEGGISIVTANDTSGAIYFADGTTGSEQYRGGIGYTHSTDKLFLVSGGQTRAWMDTNGNVGIGTGNVGIGTTSPGSGYAYDIKLDIVAPQLGGIPLRLIRDSSIVNYGAMIALAAKNSASEIITYGAITGGIIDSTDGSEDGYVSIRTIKAGVEAEKVRVDESGNVGIGTTSPTYKLDVVDGGLKTTTLSTNRIAYYNGDGVNAYGSTGWNIGNYTGDLSLTNNADDKDIIFKASAGTAAPYKRRQRRDWNDGSGD
jgi:hypothetical protein